ncbi:conserved hypothetical protein [Trichormus variabilis ATCC 29413]|uniref:2TM domain-containing protein n=2 Tax=Anabaena variabilis TaxID=264691 RepID=Q3M7M6_TRIV2|nr:MULTISPECIES: hypothetical protein [Nostocaceae]ABA23010.1 conserved hypothetical protein [Trichormus variabilis ATCC 29413]MBC1215306.1 hypothetical protein [Trichormus variabilis ARAD]MBC1256352.1 hypothetical protein [Trichormus variabilis V5]MBC1268533.1 hypothetical protein [Trichormus variabilis FSR]MBC1303971.1 hypothetical protein [Trichormus variabilis N2B]
MPPRWPRKPDRKDPEFRKLDDRMNFAVHVAVAATINSGLWFFQNITLAKWEWLPLLTAGWVIVLLAHLIYIAAIANYSPTPPKST